MFFSLLIHEYGHALTALFFGASPWITLEALGGRAEYNGYGMTPKQQFLITLNGPLLQTLLIFIPYALLKSGNFENHYYIHYLLSATMQLNIVWCLLNLLPIIPLDGGRLLHYILAGKFGEKGARASILIGLLFATIATPYLFFHGYTFFAVLIAMMGLQNLQILQQIKNPSSTSTPFANYQNALKAIDNNELEKAKTLLKKLLKTKDSKVKHLSTEALAKLHYQQNEKEQAYDLLVKTDPKQIRKPNPFSANSLTKNKTTLSSPSTPATSTRSNPPTRSPYSNQKPSPTSTNPTPPVAGYLQHHNSAPTSAKTPCISSPSTPTSPSKTTLSSKPTPPKSERYLQLSRLNKSSKQTS